MEPDVIPEMLLIAGTGRNTGKTTFACNILRKFSRDHSIISLKISPHFHKNVPGGNIIVNRDNIYIAEETDETSGKDSSLMLQAGARQSYFIMAEDVHLDFVVQSMKYFVPFGSLLLCESGGLRSHVVPGLFFMMDGKEAGIAKPSTEKLKLLADRVITLDDENIDFDLNSIEIADNRWYLKQ